LLPIRFDTRFPADLAALKAAVTLIPAGSMPRITGNTDSPRAAIPIAFSGNAECYIGY
jgi:hypothetical protein